MNLIGRLYGISKGTKHLLALTDISVTFTVPIRNLTGHLYGINKGTKHLQAFTDIKVTFTGSVKVPNI